jgi:hypothetical protein
VIWVGNRFFKLVEFLLPFKVSRAELLFDQRAQFLDFQSVDGNIGPSIFDDGLRYPGAVEDDNPDVFFL